MGIRFRCFECEHALHVKDFQAGKRGRCPECKTLFRIPQQDADYADPAHAEEAVDSGAIPDVSEPAATQSSQVTDAGNAEDLAVSDEVANVSGTLAQPAWYVRTTQGEQYGPADQATMTQWLVERRVEANAYVWTTPWEEWQLAAVAFPERFEHVGAPPSKPAVNAAPPAMPSVGMAPPTASQLPAAGGTLPVAATESPAMVGAGASVSLSPYEMGRMQRRLRKKRNYRIMLSCLLVIALVLVGALVVVLMNQTSAVSSV